MVRAHSTAALALAALACAGVDPNVARRSFNDDARRQFPSAEYIVGYGEGASRAQAEADAVNQAAVQFRGELQSVFRDTQRSTNGAVDGQVVQTIEVRVGRTATALFPVQPGLTVARGGLWQAVAVGRRADLDRTLQGEAAPIIATLRASWQRLLEARDWIDAATGWCESAARERELTALDLQRRAVTGLSFWTADLDAMRRNVIARREQARQTVRVVVTPTAGLDGQPLDAIAATLRSRGWPAETAMAVTCREPELLLVDAVVDARCRDSSLGLSLCSARVRLEAHPCGSERALFSVESAAATGTDSRSPDAARARALRTLDITSAAREAEHRILVALGESCP